MNKSHITLAVVILLLVLAFFLLFKREETTVEELRDKFYRSQTDSLLKEIKRNKELILELESKLSLHQDTITRIERQLPIINNKYYYNEKVYLSATDSLNAVLRERNQREFERMYFEGRFSPRPIK